MAAARKIAVPATEAPVSSNNVIQLQPNSRTIVVEENIPLPEIASSSDRKSKYPWLTMNVGNSFFAPDTKLTSMKVLCIGQNKKYAAKENESDRKSFVCREAEVEGVKGCRVWRVS